MLHIRRHAVSAHELLLHLQGNIVAEWSALLERECLEAIAAGLRVVVDLSGVVFIGTSGRQALGRVSRMGVRITGCPPLIAEMLEQEGIEVDRTVRGAGSGPVDANQGNN